MGVLLTSFLLGCRPLGLAGPMDERARFKCKRAGGRRASKGDAVRRGLINRAHDDFHYSPSYGLQDGIEDWLKQSREIK